MRRLLIPLTAFMCLGCALLATVLLPRPAAAADGPEWTPPNGVFLGGGSVTGGPAGSLPTPGIGSQQWIATSQSQLTAGSVSNSAHFDNYRAYIGSYQGQDVQRIAVEERIFVRVVDEAQHPVVGARVQLLDGDRRVFDGLTVSDGRVQFFPQAAGAGQAQQFRAIVSRGQSQTSAAVSAGTAEQTIALPGLPGDSGPVGLDIAFLLDATGSMGDEIDALKQSITTIAQRIEQLPGSSAPRFGLVAFRDRGDEYVTRTWDFTDVQQFTTNLAQVQAGGGGDYPESVNAGLYEALHLPGWATQDAGRRLRMIFLVGDAPPHLDYRGEFQYPDLLKGAVGQGIQIFPIGASGLTDQGEYIFRQFGMITQGQFVFLTYADGKSGAPGVTTDHHVYNYPVNNLDSLVVSLVAAELAKQTGQPAASAAITQPAAAAPAGLAPALATGLAAVAATVARLITERDAGFWLLLAILLVGTLWHAGRRTQRARLAVSLPFAPPTGAPAAWDKARLPDPPPTVAAALAAPPADGVVYAPGRPTTPLPPRGFPPSGTD